MPVVSSTQSPPDCDYHRLQLWPAQANCSPIEESISKLFMETIPYVIGSFTMFFGFAHLSVGMEMLYYPRWKKKAINTLLEGTGFVAIGIHLCMNRFKAMAG